MERELGLDHQRSLVRSRAINLHRYDSEIYVLVGARYRYYGNGLLHEEGAQGSFLDDCRSAEGRGFN